MPDRLHHRVAIAVAALYLLMFVGLWRVENLIDDVEAEIDRSVRVDCELLDEANDHLRQFADEIVAILSEGDGPETEGGRRLVADLQRHVERLFPPIGCDP